MKEYLRTIHTRSETHKKRFALIVAGVVTLLIFAIWSFVTFNNPTTVADATANTGNLAAVVAGDQDVAPTPMNMNTVTPFQDLLSGIGAAFSALKQSIGQISQSAQSNPLNTNGN